MNYTKEQEDALHKWTVEEVTYPFCGTLSDRQYLTAFAKLVREEAKAICRSEGGFEVNAYDVEKAFTSLVERFGLYEQEPKIDDSQKTPTDEITGEA